MSVKKIIFNGGILLRKNIYGVQRFTIEILKELDRIVDKGSVQILVPFKGEREVNFNNIEIVKSDNPRMTIFQKLKWDQFTFPNYVKKIDGLGVDLVVGLPFKGVDITTIYDCRTILFPQNAKSLSEKMKRIFYRERVRISIKKSKVVLTDSENAKEDICRLFHCSSTKVKVIYGAWQHFEEVLEDESVLRDFSLQDKEFFFSLGSQMRHKNIKWIVCAARQNPKYKFVVTGNSSVNEFDYETRVNIPDNVIYTGYLSDEKVKALMKHCKAFIQPSLYEGFGMPPMEAMSTGARCIVSNVSSLPEVYGKSVWYINPYDYNNISIDRIISGLIEDNRQVLNKYSWEKSANKLVEIINEVKNENRN